MIPAQSTVKHFYHAVGSVKVRLDTLRSVLAIQALCKAIAVTASRGVDYNSFAEKRIVANLRLLIADSS